MISDIEAFPFYDIISYFTRIFSPTHTLTYMYTGFGHIELNCARIRVLSLLLLFFHFSSIQLCWSLDFFFFPTELTVHIAFMKASES